MKIKVVKSDNTEVWLAAGGRESVSGFSHSGQRLTQPGMFLRAEHGKAFDRKNRLSTISFTVWVEHDSVEQCELFVLEDNTDLPTSGLVVFIAENTNGRETERYFQAGSIQQASYGYRGVSSFRSYTLLGGEMLKQKP